MAHSLRITSNRTIRLIAAVAILTSSALAQTGGRAAPTHEALWMMKRVGAPSPSPDGRQVVFPVTEPSYNASEQIADLWIVPSDGSAKPRRLTATKATESDVNWSPDSRRIAFSSKREGDEAAQIYVIDLGGGEAIRITSAPTGARKPPRLPPRRQSALRALRADQRDALSPRSARLLRLAGDRRACDRHRIVRSRRPGFRIHA
ncbi:MAG TPA: hypothetical protein VMT00_16130 [Thermoanaerobaculia bacterium]|nr:hypothetical protein [Thermoanaerobaculia bacterium]